MASARGESKESYDRVVEEMGIFLEELKDCYAFDLLVLHRALEGLQTALQSRQELMDERKGKRQAVRQTTSDRLKEEERHLVTARIRQLLGWGG